MRGTAGEEDVDDRLVPGAMAVVGLGAIEVSEGETEGTEGEGADLQAHRGRENLPKEVRRGPALAGSEGRGEVRAVHESRERDQQESRGKRRGEGPEQHEATDAEDRRQHHPVWRPPGVDPDERHRAGQHPGVGPKALGRLLQVASARTRGLAASHARDPLLELRRQALIGQDADQGLGQGVRITWRGEQAGLAMPDVLG